MASHRELLDRIAALEKTLSEARIVAGPGLTAAGSFHHGFAINATGEGLAGSAQGAAATPPSTDCPPPGAPTVMSVQAVLTGSTTSGVECSSTDTAFSADLTASCPDLTELWTTADTDCLVDCGGDAEASWVCPDPCDTDIEKGAQFGCTLIYHSATGEWELSAYFILEPPSFCGIADPTLVDITFSLNIGAGSPIGTHVIESSVGSSNPHVQWTVILS